MSKKIDTLHPKSDLTIDLYPNIQSENIPDNAITSDKLASNSVTNDKINNGAVTEDKIDNASITSDKIKEGAITTDKISDSAITSDKIKDYEITSKKLASGSVRSDALIDNSIEGQKLKTGAVGFLQLEDNAVITSKIKDYNVTEDKLAINSVSSVKIQSNAITNDKINNGAVTEDKIDNASITSDKIKEGAITSDKIANGAVGIEQLQDESVTADKIATDQDVSFLNVDTNDLTTSTINLGDGSGISGYNFNVNNYLRISRSGQTLFYIANNYSSPYTTMKISNKAIQAYNTINRLYYIPVYQKTKEEINLINNFRLDFTYVGLVVPNNITCSSDSLTFNNNANIATYNDIKYIIPSSDKNTYVILGTNNYGVKLDCSSMYNNNIKSKITTPLLENNTTYTTSCSLEKSLDPNNTYLYTFSNNSGDVRILKILSEGNFMLSITSQSIQLNDVEYLEIERLNNILFLKWYDGQEYQVMKITFTTTIDIAIVNGSSNSYSNIQY